MDVAIKTPHQLRVEEFMRKAGQEVPGNPTIPEAAIRLLRAKLILEEALETIDALGVEVTLVGQVEDHECPYTLNPGCQKRSLEFCIAGPCDIIEVVDGCCDIMVVTTGTLTAFGVVDEPLQQEVDRSNLEKFGEGSYRRDDGKWIKGPTWQPPQIQKLLEEQGWRPGKESDVNQHQDSRRKVCEPRSGSA